MAKIDKMQEVAIEKLRPYERNAKIHTESQVEKIAKSIEAFGFLSPCLIDKDFNIVAGHGRVMAAKKLGRETVPCVFIEGLSEEERRAYILADNRLTELGGWDDGLVLDELTELSDLNFDVSLTGFDFDDTDGGDWFESRERYDNDGEYDDDYQEFVEKFEPKRTTDDCYTPDRVYEAVADWVAAEYHLDRALFVRPFYPGGDYQKEKYKDGAVVVDNPPFSILAEILKSYKEHGIRFFLFAPTLILFSSSAASSCALPTGADVTYENGATVNTSFLTNLEPEELRVRTVPSLTKAVNEANEEEQKGKKVELPKYSYPDNVITAAMVARWSKYGIEFRLTRADSVQINALDAQKEVGKSIYGTGYLLSERAAAERAAAERAAAERAAAERAAAERAAATRWQLSDREIEIIKGLGAEHGDK